MVENISSKPIKDFQIRGIEGYDRNVDAGGTKTGVLTMGLSLNPREERMGVIGSSTSSAELTGYQLTVSSVTFADGQVWTGNSN